MTENKKSKPCDKAPPQGQTPLDFPWMREIPERLQQRLRWSPPEDPVLPTEDLLILLYVGKQDSSALDSVLATRQHLLEAALVAMDVLRKDATIGQDILLDQPFGELCHACSLGRVRFVGGGPNCRTWSILRWFPRPGFPQPVRGRSEAEVWGLPGLSAEEASDTDRDSLLVLRLMYLVSLATQGARDHGRPPPASFLEHPMDPAECSSSPQAHRCSTLWITRAFRTWKTDVGHKLVTFDQCTLGQEVAKSTCLSTNLQLECWHEQWCWHAGHSSKKSSNELSRYPPAMMTGIAQAIVDFLLQGKGNRPVVPLPGTEPSEVRAQLGAPLGGVHAHHVGGPGGAPGPEGSGTHPSQGPIPLESVGGHIGPCRGPAPAAGGELSGVAGHQHAEPRVGEPASASTQAPLALERGGMPAGASQQVPLALERGGEGVCGGAASHQHAEPRGCTPLANQTVGTKPRRGAAQAPLALGACPKDASKAVGTLPRRGVAQAPLALGACPETDSSGGRD